MNSPSRNRLAREALTKFVESKKTEAIVPVPEGTMMRGWRNSIHGARLALLKQGVDIKAIKTSYKGTEFRVRLDLKPDEKVTETAVST